MGYWVGLPVDEEVDGALVGSVREGGAQVHFGGHNHVRFPQPRPNGPVAVGHRVQLDVPLSVVPPTPTIHPHVFLPPNKPNFTH